jgi:hypothetical protein
VARQVGTAAAEVGVPLIDLRRALPPSAFLDLNHLFPNRGTLMAPLAAQLAARGLLAE